MKTKFRNTIAALAIAPALCLASCSGSDRTDYGEKITGGPGVYVAGGMDYAALWKDGKTQRLGKGGMQSIANSVFVDGNTVYVAGMENEKAVLWVNGERQYLRHKNEAVRGRNEAKSVFVANGKVYVAGYTRSQKGGSAPALWVDGEFQELGMEEYWSGFVMAYSVFVSGNDVYVAGDNYRSAVLWVNGVPQILTGPPDGNRPAPFLGWGYSVFVYGDDVYVAGGDSTGDSRPLLWKNGKAEVIGIGTYGASAFLRSVFVYEGDVYLVIRGAVGVGIWKNGEKMGHYEEEPPETQATRIFVSKGIVYAVGCRPGLNPMLWVNGVPTPLAPDGFPKSVPWSVFVVEDESEANSKTKAKGKKK